MFFSLFIVCSRYLLVFDCFNNGNHFLSLYSLFEKLLKQYFFFKEKKIFFDKVSNKILFCFVFLPAFYTQSINYFGCCSTFRFLRLVDTFLNNQKLFFGKTNIFFLSFLFVNITRKKKERKRPKQKLFLLTILFRSSRVSSCCASHLPLDCRKTK